MRTVDNIDRTVFEYCTLGKDTLSGLSGLVNGLCIRGTVTVCLP